MARASISTAVGRRVRTAAQNWYGYCLSPQHLVMARLDNLLGLHHSEFAMCCPLDDEIQKQLTQETKPIGNNQRQKVICDQYRAVAKRAVKVSTSVSPCPKW